MVCLHVTCPVLPNITVQHCANGDGMNNGQNGFVAITTARMDQVNILLYWHNTKQYQRLIADMLHVNRPLKRNTKLRTSTLTRHAR